MNNVELLEVVIVRLGGKERKIKLLDFLYAITSFLYNSKCKG